MIIKKIKSLHSQLLRLAVHEESSSEWLDIFWVHQAHSLQVFCWHDLKKTHNSKQTQFHLLFNIIFKYFHTHLHIFIQIKLLYCGPRMKEKWNRGVHKWYILLLLSSWIPKVLWHVGFEYRDITALTQL